MPTAGVSVAYSSKLTATQTLGDTYVSTTKSTFVLNGLDSSETYNASSSPGAVTKIATFEQALTSGNATIDLRALIAAAGSVIDGNGLKVKFIKLRGNAANANAIVVVPGASNGYNLFGTTFKVTLEPTQEILAYLANAAVAIDATHKTIDLTGTGSQVLEVAVLMGP